MFHTRAKYRQKDRSQRTSVVIPWRGFRCFTLPTAAQRHRRADRVVVIPWRGFRCFTHTMTGLLNGGQLLEVL